MAPKIECHKAVVRMGLAAQRVEWQFETLVQQQTIRVGVGVAPMSVATASVYQTRQCSRRCHS